MDDLDRRGFLKSASVAVLGAAAFSAAGAAAADGRRTSDAVGFPVRFDGPFAHGVASGDPMADRVIVWSRVHDRGEVPVDWAVATDAAMSNVVRSGTQTVRARHDFTIKVDVTGLQPATTYFYRFAVGSEHSVIGRTRTAPAGDAEHLRLAVMSCTSLWSSWWSGLGHVADRDDIDLVVHLGDYVYDFVDKDEQIRSRDRFADLTMPDNRDWRDLAECRRRYAFWRSDANLNRAHQRHPWAMVWDNHDLDPEFGNELTIPGMGRVESSTTVHDTARVFYEWTPTRPPRADGSGEPLLVDDGSYPAPADPLLIYRRLRFGALADILLTDTQSLLPTYDLPVDSSHLKGDPSLLGRRQFEWLSSATEESMRDDVRWRIIGTQTVMSPIDIPDLGKPGDLPKFGLSRWSKYPAEREAIADHLRSGGTSGKRIRRNIVLSGDTHTNVGSDFVGTAELMQRYESGPIAHNPRRGAQPGNPAAGTRRATVGGLRDAAVAVEFAPSSMGRGGFDDQIGSAIGQSGRPSAEAATISLEASDAILSANRNLQFMDGTEHGYGIVDLTHDRAVFEFWWQNKYVQNSPDVLGFQMIAWAENDRSARPARHTDQINDVRHFGLPTRPTHA
ncbi:hypothetical protein nbrc107696_13040 [Gordonia spumicola]|uniref:Phosphodiesterase/alkaline phosphatase D n=1 Tax=Gordonia spumicola TaxID=589161 RepID=A0A7I9V661_9ACTN|nr:alkaline phosphatase D family protein [Gordonia spumicola]GEE00858.1 hypothetical protein nbrc107696_13040 [Gordonia spumicola]